MFFIWYYIIDKVSMSYLFPFSRYQTKCFIEFLFRQSMASWTLKFIFDYPLRQWATGTKKGRSEIQKFKYLENEKGFLDEIKSVFHSFWRAIIWCKNKNLTKIADTNFKQKPILTTYFPAPLKIGRGVFIFKIIFPFH